MKRRNALTSAGVAGAAAAAGYEDAIARARARARAREQGLDLPSLGKG